MLVLMFFLSFFWAFPPEEDFRFVEAAALGRVFYQQYVDPELYCDRDKNGLTTLWFNAYEAVYVYDFFPKQSGVLEERGNQLILRAGDEEGFPVYMNLYDNEMIFKCYLGFEPEASIIHDTLPKIAWELVDSYKEIGGYGCQKAEGEFGGRLYEVWFAKDIPIPFGPYKLWGLPGLILEARDEFGLVRFTFAGLELFDVGKHEQEILKPVKGHRHFYSYAEYYSAMEEYRLKVHKAARARGYYLTMSLPPKDCTIEIRTW